MPQGLSGSSWTQTVAQTTAQAQREAVRATIGYLSAYLRSEGGSGGPIRIPVDEYVGKSRNGRPLAEALETAPIGAKAALKEGKELPDALQVGLTRARLAVGMDTMQAARRATLEAIRDDPRFVGWRRALRGTCGACAAVASDTVNNSVRFEVHNGCQCVSEPVVDRQPSDFGKTAKKGDRAQAAIGFELKKNKWVPVEKPVRGAIVKADDAQVMLNAGTKTKPRWITVKRENLLPLERKAARVDLEEIDLKTLPKVEPTLKGQKIRDALEQPKELFSQAERTAIRDYTGAKKLDIAEQLNRALRSGSSGDRWKNVRDGLDAAFRRVKPLEEPAVVYRGAKIKFLNRLKPGNVITDPGYVSTSPSKAVAEKFVGFDGALMEVVAPRGTKFLDINEAAGSAYGFERETLLPRGTRFVVESIKKNPKKPSQKIVRVRILP